MNTTPMIAADTTISVRVNALEAARVFSVLTICIFMPVTSNSLRNTSAHFLKTLAGILKQVGMTRCAVPAPFRRGTWGVERRVPAPFVPHRRLNYFSAGCPLNRMGMALLGVSEE